MEAEAHAPAHLAGRETTSINFSLGVRLTGLAEAWPSRIDALAAEQLSISGKDVLYSLVLP
jgi:hypothetical protein